MDQQRGGSEPVIVVGELAGIFPAIDKIGDESLESFEHAKNPAKNPAKKSCGAVLRRALYRGIDGPVQAGSGDAAQISPPLA
jgi:hypothetical protein